ncbi:MAG: HAD family phosphatase [Anaerolineae bacterium]|nr:HAD family phosphatase [Anaerolineae bacterium]
MRNLAVIFDWGGVLMCTEDYTPRFSWDDRLGLARGSVESVVHGSAHWRLAQQGKITLDVYWDGVGGELNLTPELLSELRADFYSGDRLDRSLVDLIRKMRKRGLLVGLLSNYTTDLADLIAGEGLGGLFDAQVISAEIGITKPDPAAYEAVLTELSVEPQDAFFVDDFEENVKGARSLGMRAVRFMPGLELENLLNVWISEKTDAIT